MSKENKYKPLVIKELEERLEFAGWLGGEEPCDPGGCEGPVEITIDDGSGGNSGGSGDSGDSGAGRG